MNIVFYLAGGVAVVSSIMVITRLNAMHALLYLVVSLLSVALVFLTLGAPFVAALEVIIYAGAIMVLFVFAIMLLNLGPQTAEQESQWFTPGIWRGPLLLGAILGVELGYVFLSGGSQFGAGEVTDPQQVGVALFGPYAIGVELASLLLLAGLVGAYHLGRRERSGIAKGEQV
jgi:NADH-quinone oxidoreductase subunit J